VPRFEGALLLASDDGCRLWGSLLNLKQPSSSVLYDDDHDDRTCFFTVQPHETVVDEPYRVPAGFAGPDSRDKAADDEMVVGRPTHPRGGGGGGGDACDFDVKESNCR